MELDRTSMISFCDKECINVTSNTFKKQLFHQLGARYNINPVTNSIYVRLDCNKLKNVANHAHILGIWSNGSPYLLYFTRLDGRDIILAIDRKKKENHTFPKIHIITLGFASDIYIADTIINAELIKDVNREWFFLLDDIYILNGRSLHASNIVSRYEQMHIIMRDWYRPSDTAICGLRIKRLFSYKEVKYIFTEYMPSLSYSCKGIIFYTLNVKYSNYCYEMAHEERERIPVAKSISATAPPQSADIGTILRVIKTHQPDIYHLHTASGFHSIALVPSLVLSRRLGEIFRNIAGVECIMLCKYAANLKRWIPDVISDGPVAISAAPPPII
jgi:hypothetical protein